MKNKNLDGQICGIINGLNKMFENKEVNIDPTPVGQLLINKQKEIKIIIDFYEAFCNELAGAIAKKEDTIKEHEETIKDLIDDKKKLESCIEKYTKTIEKYEKKTSKQNEPKKKSKQKVSK